MKKAIYSRRYVRIKPDFPVFGEIRIVRIEGRHVSSNSARVRLLDISCGGARFASVLKLPASKNVILELSIEYDDVKYRVEGYVTCYCNSGVKEYEYGYCFLRPEPRLRKVLINIFNSISARQDRYIILRMSQGLEN